jgi:hypothetical protein
MFQACLSAHRARVGELKTTHKKQTKECELAVQRSIDVTMYHMNEGERPLLACPPCCCR